MRDGITFHRVAAWLLTGLLVWVAPAAAQTTARNELTVFTGASLLDADRSESDRFFVLGRGEVAGLIYPGPFLASLSLGGSFEFGARYDRRLADRLSVGADFSVAPNHRLIERLRFGCPDGRLCVAPAVPSILLPERGVQVTAYHYGTNLGIDLARGAVRPSVVAGIGGVTYDAESVSATRVALRVGGRLRADAGPVGAHLEVLDVITPDHFLTGQTEHDVHVRVGLGVGW